MYEENRFKLGIFVLAGTALMIAFIFFLGLRSALEPKLKFHTIFDESVQGLEVGSPVKYKGVTIGSVSEIKILKANKKIRVNMDVNPQTIDFDPKQIDNKRYTDLITLEIENGLCCQLQMTGITGMKYIEVDYFKNRDQLEQKTGFKSGFIPPGVSILKSTIDTVSEALSQIAKVDFEAIGKDLQGTMNNMSKLTNIPELKEGIKAAKDTIVEINRAVEKFNTSTEKGRIANFADALDKTLAAVNSLSVEIKKQVEAADLRGISQEFQSTLKEIKGAGSETSQSVNIALKKLNMTLTEITELVDFLEEDPAALLRGKQKKDRFAE